MEKILLVEDDANLVLGIEYALKNEGYEVLVATCLEEGRVLMNRHTFDLILLDVMLPDGKGYDLCKEVRQGSEVGIIFLTACDEEVNVVMGLDMGGDDYITKPFRIRELISRIKAVLRRKATDSGNLFKLVSGDLELILMEGKVRKEEKELYLTPVEYKLLVTFLKNPKQLLSRQTLLEHIWDLDGEFIDDNTLSVYIKRLREKIEGVNEKNYILTVRGRGYRWDVEVRRVNLA